MPHWGVDKRGFRIVAFLKQCAAEADEVLLPWRTRAVNVPGSLRWSASARTVEQMFKYACAAEWSGIAHELVEVQLITEQEG